MDFLFLISLLGASFILIPFLLMKLNYLNEKDLYFNLLNFIGALLLTISAYLLDSLAFLILNIIWAMFALKDIFKQIK
jgi:hypothetical protein